VQGWAESRKKWCVTDENFRRFLHFFSPHSRSFSGGLLAGDGSGRSTCRRPKRMENICEAIEVEAIGRFAVTHPPCRPRGDPPLVARDGTRIKLKAGRNGEPIGFYMISAEVVTRTATAGAGDMTQSGSKGDVTAIRVSGRISSTGQSPRSARKSWGDLKKKTRAEKPGGRPHRESAGPVVTEQFT